MRRTLTAFFDDYGTAAEAVRRLESAGISYRDISLVAHAASPRQTVPREIVPQGTTEDGTAGAGSGAAAGGAIGGGIGLLAGLGAIVVPGLGPVVAAGWLAAVLTGAAAGAATGGLVGILVGEGLSGRDADIYAAGLKRGGVLVVARLGERDYAKGAAILQASPARDLATRTDAAHPAAFANAAPPAAGPALPEHRLIRGDRVEGTSVYGPNGTHLGVVRRLMLDRETGRVDHVVISAGDFFGVGGGTKAIPWDALSYDAHLQGYRTTLSEDQLRAAPA